MSSNRHLYIVIYHFLPPNLCYDFQLEWLDKWVANSKERKTGKPGEDAEFSFSYPVFDIPLCGVQLSDINLKYRTKVYRFRNQHVNHEKWMR